MYRISNSEVVSFNACKQKWYNEYVLRLKKKKLGEALAAGIAAHDALKEYYKTRKRGGGHGEGMSNAKALLTNYLRDRIDEFGMKPLMKAKHLLDKYFEYYGPDDNWEILEVEKKYELELVPGKLSMPLRIDILVRDKERDKIILVDTKSTYDFWTPLAENLSPQFPKYVVALRKEGIEVDEVIVNQIRTREMKAPKGEQLFKRSPIPITPAKMRNNLANHHESSKAIVAHRLLTPEEQVAKATKLQYDKTCKYCSFAGLCEMELDGQDTRLYIQQFYNTNDYGYGDNDRDS